MYCLAGAVPGGLNYKEKAVIDETRAILGERGRKRMVIMRDVLIPHLKLIKVCLMFIYSRIS